MGRLNLDRPSPAGSTTHRRRWQWPRRPSHRHRIIGRVDYADDLPDVLPSRSLLLVGARGREQWLALQCPLCGEHQLMLNLANSRTPRWTLSGSRRRPNLSPSVDAFTDTRRCHFWVRRGRIQLVSNPNAGQNDSAPRQDDDHHDRHDQDHGGGSAASRI
jgi:hypothetical protein